MGVLVACRHGHGEGDVWRAECMTALGTIAGGESIGWLLGWRSPKKCPSVDFFDFTITTGSSAFAYKFVAFQGSRQ